MSSFHKIFHYAIAGAVCLGPSTASADPAPKSAGVFAINQALMLRCSEYNSVNIALTNAALVKDDDIAHRDVIRIVNSCALKLKEPRRAAFSVVGAEALASDGCKVPNCSGEQKEGLGETIFRANKEFTNEYAKVLLHSIKAACEADQSNGCVKTGINAANDTVELFDYPWMRLSGDNRIIQVGDMPLIETTPQEGEAPAQTSGEAIPEIKKVRDKLKEVWPEGPSMGFSLAGKNGGQLAAAGFAVKDETGEFSIPHIQAPATVTSALGFWSVNLKLSKSECEGIVGSLGGLEATEVTAGLSLVRSPSDAAKVCKKDGVKVSVVY